MNFEDCLKIFLAICAGVGALKVVISSVKNCISQEMTAVNNRLARLEKDDDLRNADIKAIRLLLSSIEKGILSREVLKEIIRNEILKHKDECPKK